MLSLKSTVSSLVIMSAAGGPDAFAVEGFSPDLVASFTLGSDNSTEGEYFRSAGSDTTFGSLFTFARTGSAWYFDSSGVLTEATSGNARRDAYYYNGTSWVKGGLQLESAAATQLLHGTDSFATQTESVTAQAYTLQFRGTGSITLSGAHSATLTGTGANDLVSLTFTPSAGTLTLTPSGTVDYPMLSVGTDVPGYVPNTAASGTVTRSAETLSIAAANLPYSSTAMSIHMEGLMTYVDDDTANLLFFFVWSADASNLIQRSLRGGGAATGAVRFLQRESGTNDSVNSAADVYSPGVNVPFNTASAHTSGRINGAVDGTALTEDATPTALPDLSSTDMDIATDFNGFITLFRMWDEDITDTGLETATA